MDEGFGWLGRSESVIKCNHTMNERRKPFFSYHYVTRTVNASVHHSIAPQKGG